MISADDLTHAAAERGANGEAWRDFCDTLRAVGDIILRESTDDLDRAEGFRYLTRLTRNSLERFVENNEPYRPRVRDTAWRGSIGIQSPDQDHPLIEIDGNLDYRIRGRRNTISYASFLALASAIPAEVGATAAPSSPEAALDTFDPSSYRPTGFLSIHDLDINPDGTFEIILSQRKHAGNWLRLEPESSFIMIRQTYLDRSRERAMDLTVERLDPEPVRPIRPDELARNLAIAAQNVVGTTARFLHWAHELEKAPDTLTRIDGEYRNAGGSPDHLMYFGYWELEPDEALVVTARLPSNDYWNFQACNWWLENFDNYDDDAGYLTKRTAQTEPDGTVVLVLAHERPSRGNWIDVFGHRRGTMNLRVVHPDGEADVTVDKVPLSAVNDG